MDKIIKNIVFGEHQLVINFVNIFEILVLDPLAFEILIQVHNKEIKGLDVIVNFEVC
jgi:hypothetical protein